MAVPIYNEGFNLKPSLLAIHPPVAIASTKPETPNRHDSHAPKPLRSLAPLAFVTSPTPNPGSKAALVVGGQHGKI